MLSAVLSCFGQYDKDVFMFRGRAALSEGKYSEAINNFNILARLDTTDCWVYFYRGIAKYNLGDLRGAQSDFDSSVRVNPVFTNGYHFRAITLSRTGKYDEALADLQRALELRPGMDWLRAYPRSTYWQSRMMRNISVSSGASESFAPSTVSQTAGTTLL